MFSKKRLIIFIASSILLLVITYNLFFNFIKVSGYKIQKHDVLNGITSTGVVTSPEEILVAPDVTSVISKRLFSEDTYVKKGQILAYLNTVGAKGALEQAQSNYNANYYALRDLQTEPRLPVLQISKEQYNSASEDVNISQDQLNKAQAKLNDAILEETKLQTLYKQGAISLRDYEKSQYSVKDAQEAVNIAKRQLLTTNIAKEESKQNYILVEEGTKKEKILSQKSSLDASKGSVIVAKDNLDSQILRAPVDGYISDRLLNAGEVASPSKPILRMFRVEDLYITAKVEEFDIKNIKLGQDAVIVFDAYPDKAYTGKVTAIVKSVNNITGTFDVKVRLNPQKGLKYVPGMTSDVTIITEKIKNAEIIPRKYVYEENDHNFVYVLNGNKAKKEKITIIPFDNSRVLLTSPLPNNTVILYDENKKVKDNVNAKVTDYDSIGNTDGRIK
ncbi:MAG: HlyD family secretion protein [bacterium]